MVSRSVFGDTKSTFVQLPHTAVLGIGFEPDGIGRVDDQAAQSGRVG
jgi:hypothetical protein